VAQGPNALIFRVAGGAGGPWSTASARKPFLPAAVPKYPFREGCTEGRRVTTDLDHPAERDVGAPAQRHVRGISDSFSARAVGLKRYWYHADRHLSCRAAAPRSSRGYEYLKRHAGGRSRHPHILPRGGRSASTRRPTSAIPPTSPRPMPRSHLGYVHGGNHQAGAPHHSQPQPRLGRVYGPLSVPGISCRGAVSANIRTQFTMDRVQQCDPPAPTSSTRPI